MRPDVSVVIPVHNGERFIAQAIESALNQEGADVEVIVVDDASSDESPSIIKSYGDRVTYLPVTKQATGIAATNIGVERASSDLVCVLHHDDYLLPGKLARHVALMRAHPEIGFSYSAQHFVDESGRELGTLHSPVASGDYVLPGGRELTSLALHNYISFCNAVVRKSALAKVGFFPSSLQIVGEWLTWIRLAKEHYVGYVSEPLVCYRLHADQLTYKRSTEVFRGQLELVHEETFRGVRPSADVQRLRRLARGNIYLSLAFVHAFKREGGQALRAAVLAAVRIRPWELAAFGRSAGLPLRLRIALARLHRHRRERS